MEINAATLPNTPSELKEIIIGLHGQMAGLREVHEKETDILLEQIRHLRAQLFGRKTEKIQGGPQTLPLFDMPEPAEEDEAEEKVHVPAHDRRKRGRKPLPEELPRVEVVHDIDDADKICPCGCQLSRIGEEVSEQLDIIPAKIVKVWKMTVRRSESLRFPRESFPDLLRLPVFWRTS
jgi:transposase